MKNLVKLLGLNLLLMQANSMISETFLNPNQMKDDLSNVKDLKAELASMNKNNKDSLLLVAVRQSEKELHHLPIIPDKAKPTRAKFVPVFSEKFINENKGNLSVNFFYKDKGVGLALIYKKVSSASKPEPVIVNEPEPVIVEEKKEKEKKNK
jgi:hypothetical protein